MLKNFLLIIISVLVCAAFSVPERVAKKADKVIGKFYETETFSKEFIVISENENAVTPSEFTEDNFFKISTGESFLGYGYIGNAPSKTATYDYLVLFDENMIVTKSSVLIYREEYGGEISSKRWLKQFIGTSSKTPPLLYRKDIIPISGATISVQSMTRAMNQLLQSIAKLQYLKAI